MLVEVGRRIDDLQRVPLLSSSARPAPAPHVSGTGVSRQYSCEMPRPEAFIGLEKLHRQRVLLIARHRPALRETSIRGRCGSRRPG